jgi:hypothetical protein
VAGRDTDHSSLSNAEVKNGELNLFSLLWRPHGGSETAFTFINCIKNVTFCQGYFYTQIKLLVILSVDFEVTDQLLFACSASSGTGKKERECNMSRLKV